jgi:uncharacterized protein (TIGR00251 family)
VVSGAIKAQKWGITVNLLVKPRAARFFLGPVHDDCIKVAVPAPPVDGAANEALVVGLCRCFRIRRSAVRIRSGLAGRRKTVDLEGVTSNAFLDALGPSKSNP